VTARSLALVLGILYAGLGVLGLMPGALAGLFPVDPILALVHLAIGAWGLAAYIGRASAHVYARGAAFILVALGLAGMLQGIDRFLMPLHGPNVWLHLVSAGVAGFVAWRPRTGERRSLLGERRRRRAAPLAASASVTTERRDGTYDRRKAPAAA
jgi:uncharacterized protein DUF4383